MSPVEVLRYLKSADPGPQPHGGIDLHPLARHPPAVQYGRRAGHQLSRHHDEGEAVFEGDDEGETETDLLYSRLVTPFWNAQIGVQYANGWTRDDYEDRWSGVIGLQGMAPYMFEIDASLYVSEDGDATAEFEAEYDLRITQRLVLQPRAELAFAAQDIPERDIGAGITDAVADLRLRYEIKREFAPYIGVRYRTLVGETDNNAEAAGADSEQVFFMAGILFAF